MESMRKWFVRDRDGREVYLTEQQWQHIVSGHGELRNHLDHVLNTVRRGKRQQKPLDPKAYVYRLTCDALRPHLTEFWYWLHFILSRMKMK